MQTLLGDVDGLFGVYIRETNGEGPFWGDWGQPMDQSLHGPGLDSEHGTGLGYT